jgi:thiamine-phosphate pyrophosphorylase
MKSYLITDAIIYSSDIKVFKHTLTNLLAKTKVDYICFRDKISSNYKQLAKEFVDISKKHNIQNIFINQYITLAKELKAHGVHLTSIQFDDISYAKELKLKVIISCHNEDDILKAISSNVDYITYSPIFNTPNKGKPKDIEHLQYIVNKYNHLKIFALGGIISPQHITMIKQTNPYGFASIRYFLR